MIPKWKPNELDATIAYDTPSNFVFDNTKVDVTSVAALKLQANAGLAFSQSFASASGFTHDSAKAEFASGLLRQLAQRPAGATFAAKFNSQVNASWGNGDLAATATGGAGISGGKLNLSGGGKYVTFDGVDNVSQLGMLGCLQLRFTPDYNGSPSTNQVMVDLIDSGDTSKNRITLMHLGNGSFFLVMNDSDGNNQLSNSIAPYDAVSGTEVELELSWDLANNIVRVFGEGFLVAEVTTAFARTNTIDTIQVGDADADFFERDLVFFDAVQHTANYTAHEYALPNADYVESVAILPAFTYGGPGTLQAFTAFAVTTAGVPKFLMNGRYWNGSAWVVSDGTYAQSSTAAAVASNIASLAPSSPLTVKVVFGDGNTLGSIDALTVTYTGQIYPTNDPAIVNGSGVAADDLLEFAATLSASGSDDVRFQLVVGGINKYWSGSAWATSDGTLAQANTAATILANIDELDVSAGAVVKVRAVLHSATGATTPSLTSVVVVYDFFAAIPDAPSECIVFGHARDILGETAEGGAPTLIVALETAFFSGDYLLLPSTKRVTADDEGRFEVSLVETDSVDKAYVFSLEYFNEATSKLSTALLGSAVVPNQVSVNLADLTFT